MDKSGDGKISKSEVKSGFKRLEFKESDELLDKITENVCSVNKRTRC